MSQTSCLGAQPSRVRYIPDAFYGFSLRIQKAVGWYCFSEEICFTGKTRKGKWKKVFKALRLHGGVTAGRLEATVLKGIYDQQKKKLINFLPLKLEYTEQGSQEQHL